MGEESGKRKRYGEHIFLGSESEVPKSTKYRRKLKMPEEDKELDLTYGLSERLEDPFENKDIPLEYRDIRGEISPHLSESLNQLNIFPGGELIDDYSESSMKEYDRQDWHIDIDSVPSPTSISNLWENQSMDGSFSLYEEEMLSDHVQTTSNNEGNVANEAKESNHIDEETFDYLNEKVFPGLDTCVGEVIYMEMMLGMRHSHTWVDTLDHFKMLNTMFGKKIFPETKYMLQKYIPGMADTRTYHLFCEKCLSYLCVRPDKNTKLECSCKAEYYSDEVKSYFIQLSIKEQLKNLLAQKHISEQLKNKSSRQKINDEAIEDIYDGAMYKGYEELENPDNISLTFNTDGVQAAKSSTTKIWPIYVSINELPVHMREKHILLAGLWVHKKEPCMNTFLHPFVDEMNDLTDNGFEWECEGKKTKSKVFAILCTVDSPARCAMLNMKQYNGYFGCTFCTHPVIKQPDGQLKYTVLEKIPPDRTDESIKQNMLEAVEDRKEIGGVHGPSVLMNLEKFDLGDGFDPDYMHAALIGVVQQWTNLILNSSKKPFYVGAPKTLDLIESRLLAITPPRCITRTPRSLRERNNWKASEWRSWLLLYALPCLDGILDSKYCEHISLFITAMNIFLKKSITLEEINLASDLLMKFSSEYQEHFGPGAMTYNVHLLSHTAKSIRNWGPLWVHSTFPFENQNRILLTMKKSPNNLCVQMVNRLMTYQSLEIFSSIFKVDEGVEDFVGSLFNKQKRLILREVPFFFTGASKKSFFTDAESKLTGLDGQSCDSFDQIMLNGIRYTTHHYERAKKTNDSVVKLKSGEFAILTKFYSFKINGEDKEYIFYYEIRVGGSFIDSQRVNMEHILRVNQESTPLSFITEPTQIVKPYVMVESGDDFYVIDVPFGCYRD